jgi:hypothetical protein
MAPHVPYAGSADDERASRKPTSPANVEPVAAGWLPMRQLETPPRPPAPILAFYVAAHFTSRSRPGNHSAATFPRSEVPRMNLPSIREVCQPRRDILMGGSSLDLYAAKLSQVARHEVPEVYETPLTPPETTAWPITPQATTAA